MKALVVYDSFFGNTEKIAKAVSEALSKKGEARAMRVNEVSSKDLVDLNVLVVGSPTRAFSASPAIKSFLKNLPAKSLCGVRIAAFDTRLPINEKTPGILRFLAGIFGYADKPMMDALLKKGGESAGETRGFLVTDTEGPLAEGELESAAAWAEKIYSA
jgi:flavodoxin